MYSVDACMVCGEAKRTTVAEYNRLIYLDSMWQNDIARYDYALCHGCGVVYATRRPERAEYEFLYEHFNEFLIRGSKTEPEGLTPKRAQQIDRDFVPWWEIRSAPSTDSGVRSALQTDLAGAVSYLPYLVQHIPLEGSKVLHIRAKGSTLADILKRMLGAKQVDLITLFPDQTYLAEKNNCRAEPCLDYENFRIPFDEKYNLIIENHVFVHMLNANSTFDMLISHLEDDGFMFVHKELDDTRLFNKRKNLFAELRPFHFQQFDMPTIKRILDRYGFEVPVLELKIDKNFLNDPYTAEFVGLAKLTHRGGRACQRIGSKELRARLDLYAQWRDESILSLPKELCHALYGKELKDVWERVRARGGLRPDRMGEARAVRRFRERDVKDRLLEIDSVPVRPTNAGRVAGWVARKLRTTRFGKRAKHLAYKMGGDPKLIRQDKTVS